eukprot:TRINITY_DN8896_c0_g2_i3.p1 TRINITY_DN8896_c0_g2~~TRINITY_DN8896_c0_g2_i3.p1  ORF type:complete len:405 (-),score=76.97 TRINITY_DN8896_c0_g2_i3:61-1275(-)
MYRSAPFVPFLLFLYLAGLIACQGDCPFDIVKLQLNGTKLARYAGYYAAQERNYYTDECLLLYIDQTEVNVLQEVISSASIIFGAYWTQEYLQDVGSQAEVLDVINIGQMLYKSGFFLASLATSDSVIKGKRISVWPGLDAEPKYFLKEKYGIDLSNETEVVTQATDVSKLYDGSIDYVSCTTYDEYAQLLRTRKKNTNELYQPDDLKIFMSDMYGLGMLKDGIIVKKSWFTSNSQAKDISLRFMKATLKGWMYCRDNFDECITLLNLADVDGAIWELNEILDMMFTGSDKVGTMNFSRLNTTLNGLIATGAVSHPVNISNYFDFDFIEDVYAALDHSIPQQSFDYSTAYKKSMLTWCYDPMRRMSVLCYGSSEDSTSSDSISTTSFVISMFSIVGRKFQSFWN